MLTIRDSQLRVFEPAARERFVLRLCAALVEGSLDAAHGRSAAALRTDVEHAVECGLSHGLRSEAGVASFVTLWLSLGPRVVSLPAVRAVLAGPKASLDERMLRFTADTTSDAWARYYHDATVMPWDALDALDGER